MPVALPLARPLVVLLGLEGAGKSALAAGLTGRAPAPGGYRGATVESELYRGEGRDLVDTPGLLRAGDSRAAADALARLADADAVLVVTPAGHVDADLERLLPLVAGRRGAVVVTRADEVADAEVLAADGRPIRQASSALEDLARDLGVGVALVDARELSAGDQASIEAALAAGGTFAAPGPRRALGWSARPRRDLFGLPVVGPLLALALLVVPATLAVQAAGHAATLIEPVVQAALAAPVARWGGHGGLVGALLAGRYGLLTMGPLLVVWAAPTVVLFALLLAVLKASGLVDGLTVGLEPLARPVGLAGRDLVRVLMGFGCNVPAVVATRTCASCSRDACLAAIAFGSACSYQLGATLAVFAAVSAPWLVWPYLAALGASTALHLRLTRGPARGAPPDPLLLVGRTRLVWPRPREVAREVVGTARSFATTAAPIFVVIALAASLLDHLGLIAAVGAGLGPLLAPFDLPAEAGLAVAMAAVRKDGLLLLADPALAPHLGPAQVLTATYLGGVLLPCLVTVITIARERSARIAFGLVWRQAAFALVAAWILARAGRAALP